MHRFFVNKNSINGDKIIIEGSGARQIANVLRLAPGDVIIALDGVGGAYEMHIESIKPSAVTGSILRACPMDSEPKVRLTLAQSLPKGDKLEMVIQKGTEIGVSKFEIISTSRTVARPPDERVGKRLERWKSIATEASEQSCRMLVPEIDGIANLKEFLPTISQYDLAICLWEGEDNQQIRELLCKNRDVASILIIVGPEGGFSEPEVKMMQDAGAIAASLGKRILRCETAAIAAAAVALYELDS